MHGTTQERMDSPEPVVIYFASIIYHLKKALPINIIALCLVTQQGVVRDNTKRLLGQQFPRRSADYCVVKKSASSQKS